MSRRKRSRKIKTESKNPFAHAKFTSYTMDQSHMPMAEKLRLMREFAAECDKNFEENLQSIHAELLKTNPLQTLSSLSHYYLQTMDATSNEWKHPEWLLQHEIELIQALCLKHAWSEYQFTRSDFTPITKMMKDVTPQFMHRRMKALPTEFTDEQRADWIARESVRVHTQAVRNWSYPQIMHYVTRRLAEKLDAKASNGIAILPSECIDLFFNIVRLVEARSTSFLNRFLECQRASTKGEMLAAYAKLFPYDPHLEDSKLVASNPRVSLHEFRAHLLVCRDFLLPIIYSLVPEDIAHLLGGKYQRDDVVTLMDALSLRFGDIDEADERLFMCNPIHRRPMIKLSGGKYVLPIPSLLISFCMEIIEGFFSSDSAKKAFHKARSSFLEEELASTFSSNFPRAAVYRGSKWKSDIDGKVYENDLLVVVDSVALIVEAKAGRVDDSAKRGGDRLSTEIRKLLLAPAEQALRFVDYLSRNRGVHQFETKDGIADVDITRVTEMIPIAITLDDLNLRWEHEHLAQLSDLDRVPTFLLSDLMIAMDFLPSETLRLHYLLRRYKFEDVSTFVGDEIDLLSFYMKTRLTAKLPAATQYIGIGESRPIDEYYLKEHEGIAARKPEMPFTKRWHGILQGIDSTKEPEWFGVGRMLLDVSFDEQQKLERKLKELIAKVRSGKEKSM